MNYFCAATDMIKLRMDELGRKSADEFRNAGKLPVIAVLENIRSAYNVGSLFRTADAFLLEAIYLTGYTATPPHKEISKTALGAEETVDWRHFPDTASAIRSLQESGYKVWAVEQTRTSCYLQDFVPEAGQKTAVVFGNEVSGVEESTLEICAGCIEIPQLGMKHSLNVATAAGVVLWELIRHSLPPGKAR